MLTRKGLKILGVSSVEKIVNRQIMCGDNQFALTVVGVIDAYPPLLKNNLEGQPDMFFLNPGATGGISVRYGNTTFTDTQEQIQKIWANIYPNETLYYTSEKQLTEQGFNGLFTVLWSIGGFGLLAIIISLMGLYAMSVFTVERRTKEIGIRKVLGASPSSLVRDLIIDTCKPVLISLAIACPLSYLLGNLLKQYFYQTPPLLLISFVMVPSLLLAIAVLSVFWHSYKAANTNPAKALRYE